MIKFSVLFIYLLCANKKEHSLTDGMKWHGSILTVTAVWKSGETGDMNHFKLKINKTVKPKTFRICPPSG